MSAIEEKAVLTALRKFAGAVTDKMTSFTPGEPEDQLRSPFENFMKDVGSAIVRDLVCTGETRLPNRLGKPDYAVHSGKILIGFVGTESSRSWSNHKPFYRTDCRVVEADVRTRTHSRN